MQGKIGTINASHRHDERRRSLWVIVFFLLVFASGQAQEVKIPAKAYVYLEPFSARVECLVRLVDFLPMVGEKVTPLLTVADQEHIKDLARKTAAQWPGLKVDAGDDGKLTLSNVDIVLGEPGRTQPLKAGESVAVMDAMIGMVWERDLPASFDAITLEWNGLGANGLSSLPVSVIPSLGNVEDFTMTPASNVIGWRNRGRVTLRSPLEEVPLVPAVDKIHLPLGSLLWILFGTAFLWAHMRSGKRVPGRTMTTFLSLFIGAAVFWPVLNIAVDTPGTSRKPVDSEHATRILSALLRNVYKSFDRKTESDIYDVLARSIHGELLQKIYLQVVSSLTLDAQEGTRVKLDESPTVVNPFVQVDGIKMLEPGYGFVADTRWTVIGTVGHWGHQHQRVNRYKAKVTVEPVTSPAPVSKTSREWKITALEVEEERRM